MEIYLVRHTAPKIKKGICYGQTDLDVANSFDQESIHIHKELPAEKITQIYSSPLKRCSVLAETFKKPIIYDPRLKEINFGSWELKAWNDIDSQELDPWMNDFVNKKVPNGESYVMLQERVLASFFDSIKNREENILIVSHASPIRVILAAILNKPLSKSFEIKIAYGQVFKIIKTKNGLELLT